MSCICIIGESLSEPHIDEFAANYICLYRRSCHFRLIFYVFLQLSHASIIQTAIATCRLGARDCLTETQTMNASSHLALGRTMNSLLERVRAAQQERLKAETDEQRDARLESMTAVR